MGRKHPLTEYIDAANRGNWLLCRAICNSRGIGPMGSMGKGVYLQGEELDLWTRLYNFACVGSEQGWLELRDELFPRYPEHY